MAAHVVCAECRTANRAGLLFCAVCGRRLPREAYPPDRVTAVAWPGPEVRVADALEAHVPGWTKLGSGLLTFSALPIVGAAVSVCLGSVPLAVGLLAGAGLGAMALLALSRGD
jgi:hypothetical protein